MQMTASPLRACQAEPRFNPDMLRLARDYWQHTRKGLAEMIEVSPGFITQIEDGTKQPSEVTIEKITAALKFPRDFFFQQGRFEAAPTSIFRRRVSIPRGTMITCTARLAIAKRTVERMLELLNAPNHKIPSIDPNEVKGGAGNVAKLVRRALRIPDGPIRSIVEILEESGVLVIPFDFGTAKIDGCSDWIDGQPVIFYNPACQRSRLRHTLAHELGHLVMHTMVDEGDCEDEADAFASEFNMPSDEIKSQLLPMNMRRLAVLKAYWKSSMSAILYKSKVLGVVSEYKYRSMFIQLREMCRHMEEPNEELVPHERPQSIPYLLQAYTQEVGGDVEGVLQHLRLSESVFSQILPTSTLLRAV